MSVNMRQSDSWGKFLERLGWRMHRTSFGANIAIHPFPFGNLVKVQRPPLLKKEDLEEIDRVCLENRAMFVKVDSNYGQDTKVLEEAGYALSVVPLSPPSTIWVSLEKPEAELWKDVSRSGKYSIKRAQRAGIKVEYYRNPSLDKLQTYYKEVLKPTGKKKKFYVPPFKQLVYMLEAFGDSSFLILGRNKDGDIVGGGFYVGNEDQVLYVHGGTTEIGRKIDAGHGVLWKSILYFKKIGYKNLDFEGKDDPRFPDFTRGWGGFSYFKEKFGGQVIEFPYPYVKFMNPLLKQVSEKLSLPF